jgi:glycosyltransferase involved in cell wall biosynthesis
VLHVARDWVRPSEGFVLDLVQSSRQTVPVLAYGSRWPEVALPAAATDLTRLASRLPLRPADRAARTALALLARRRHVDVLHAHFGYWAHLVAPAARRAHRPWSVSLHGHDLLVEGDPHGVLPLADRVVVPSQYLAEAAGRLGIPDERLRVIPSGLDLSRLPFRERTPRPDGAVVVTFVGRYVEKKGVLDAARAVAAARAELPGLVARFVGSGPLEEALRRLLGELRLPAELIDGTQPGAVVDALDSTDLLLTASRVAADGDAETLGLVNLEALACGVPVVTTATGGVPEALASSGALLVAEGDVAGLASALVALARDPGRWEPLGRSGRAHVEKRFALADRVGDFEELWLELARPSGR